MIDALSVHSTIRTRTGIRERHRHIAVAADQAANGERIVLARERPCDAQHTPLNQRPLAGSGRRWRAAGGTMLRKVRLHT